MFMSEVVEMNDIYPKLRYKDMCKRDMKSSDLNAEMSGEGTD